MGLKELIFGKQIKQAHAAQYRNSTQGWLPVLDVQNGDRKSTRLNSSH